MGMGRDLIVVPVATNVCCSPVIKHRHVLSHTAEKEAEDHRGRENHPRSASEEADELGLELSTAESTALPYLWLPVSPP